MNTQNPNFPHLAPRLAPLPRDFSAVPRTEAQIEDANRQRQEKRQFEQTLFEAANNIAGSGIGGDYQLDPQLPEHMRVVPTSRPGEISPGVQITPRDSEKFDVDYAIRFRTPQGIQVQSRRTGTEDWIPRSGLADVPRPYLDAMLGFDQQIRGQRKSEVAEKGKGFLRRLTRR